MVKMKDPSEGKSNYCGEMPFPRASFARKLHTRLRSLSRVHVWNTAGADMAENVLPGLDDGKCLTAMDPVHALTT